MSEEQKTYGVDKSRITTIRDLLNRTKGEIERAVPKHIDPDRLLRVAMTSIQKNYRLLECDEKSLLGAIMESAQLGLTTDGILGQAYLVPYKVKGVMRAQLQIGYRGFLELAWRSGQIQELYAYPVYEKDQFSFTLGLNRDLKHVPNPKERGECVASYAVVRLKEGGLDFEVLQKVDLDKTRSQSKAADDGPWVTHYDEMARKTAIRRLAKRLPLSTDFVRAAVLDEYGDQGIIDIDPNENIKSKTQKRITEMKERLIPDPPQTPEPGADTSGSRDKIWVDLEQKLEEVGKMIEAADPWTRENWIKIRKPGFSSYVYENLETLHGAPQDVIDEAMGKWESFYNVPCPFNAAGMPVVAKEGPVPLYSPPQAEIVEPDAPQEATTAIEPDSNEAIVRKVMSNIHPDLATCHIYPTLKSLLTSNPRARTVWMRDVVSKDISDEATLTKAYGFLTRKLQENNIQTAKV